MYNPIVELSLIDVALNIMILFIICLKHQDHDILNYAVPCIMMFYTMLIKKKCSTLSMFWSRSLNYNNVNYDHYYYDYIWRHESEIETWEKGVLWCERDTASIFSVPVHLDEAEEYKWYQIDLKNSCINQNPTMTSKIT